MCCFSISMAIKRTQKSLLLTTIMLLFPVTAILADDYQISALDMTLDRLPAKRYLEIKTLYPPEFFPDLINKMSRSEKKYKQRPPG